MPDDPLSITPGTKVATLLKHFPQLEDVLIGMAPAFRKLKNPVLRMTVAKVASLRQAAAAGGVPLEDMVNRLRAAVGQGPLTPADAGGAGSYFEASPEWFDRASVVASIDEREIRDEDKMPLATVTQKAAALRERESLELITTFVPAPGIDIMRKKGYRVWSEADGTGLIRTYFSRPPAE